MKRPECDAAVQRGWNIIPVNNEKRPVIHHWKPFMKRRVTPEELEDWETTIEGICGWAVLTGSLAGIVILDFDGKDGGALLAKLGLRPHIRTRSGGFHVYFRHPGWNVGTFNSKSKKSGQVIPGLDVRGDGGYAVFTGEIDGGRYQLLRSLDDLEEPAALPDDVRVYCGLDRPAEPQEKPIPPKVQRVLDEKNRDDRVRSSVLLGRALELVQSSRGRNNAGFWLAEQLRDNRYDQGEARQVMLEFWRCCPDTNSKGEREAYTRDAALKSLASAYSMPAREPWGPSQYTSRRQDFAYTEPPPPPPPPNGPPPSDRAEAKQERPTDDENLDKQQFVKKSKKDEPPHPNSIADTILAAHSFLCSHEEKPIWKFNGAFWKLHSVQGIQALALKVDGERRSNVNRRREVVSYIRAASFQPEIQWNVGLKPSEIPFMDGVLDLETMELRPHREKDYLDAVFPHLYSTEADAPVWQSTLESFWQDSPEGDTPWMLLQEYAGYCLMAGRPRKALLLHGPKDVGKTVVVEVFRQIVGEDFCCSIRLEDMSDPRRLSPIVGKRLNIIAEVAQRAYIADAGFNSLLGGDMVQVDPKFRDPYTLIPAARHLIAANETPAVHNYSGAVFKRLLILPMLRQFTPAEQDPDLSAKITAELPGVVAWAVQGARRLWRNGMRFTIPESSREALLGYEERENAFLDFIESHCQRGDGFMVPRLAVFSEFRRWTGRQELRDSEIRAMLRGVGLDVSKSPIWYEGWGKTVRCVLGVRFADRNGDEVIPPVPL